MQNKQIKIEATANERFLKEIFKSDVVWVKASKSWHFPVEEIFYRLESIQSLFLRPVDQKIDENHEFDFDEWLKQFLNHFVKGDEKPTL